MRVVAVRRAALASVESAQPLRFHRRRRTDPGRTGYAVRRVYAPLLAAGVFGVPSYVYRDELFWVQDRLDFLAAALVR